MSDTLFRFSMRAAVADSSGYYVTRWDRAQRMTVIGSTQDEAVSRASKMLGKPDRGRCWTFIFDGSDEIFANLPAEPASGPLPYWKPCNPACDTELNGYRDRGCSCEPARMALSNTAPPAEQEGKDNE